MNAVASEEQDMGEVVTRLLAAVLISIFSTFDLFKIRVYVTLIKM